MCQTVGILQHRMEHYSMPVTTTTIEGRGKCPPGYETVPGEPQDLTPHPYKRLQFKTENLLHDLKE